MYNKEMIVLCQNNYNYPAETNNFFIENVLYFQVNSASFAIFFIFTRKGMNVPKLFMFSGKQ